MQDCYAQFNASLFGFDEALLSDDTVLAGALWRNIYGIDHSIDPISLDILIQYTRVQVS